MCDKGSGATAAVAQSDAALEQYFSEVSDNMSLPCMGSESFSQGFHRSRPGCSAEDIAAWYMEHQDDVLSLLNSCMKLCSKTKPKDKRKMDEVFEKTKFQPEGVPVGAPREVDLSMLQRVLDGRPHPNDLYDLEGSLVKFIVCSADPEERYILCLLWTVVYIGMRGAVRCEYFLVELEAAHETRAERLKCKPQVRLLEAWKAMFSLQQEECCAWDSVIQALFGLRDYLKHPSDVMTCGLHPAYMCPADVTYDIDHARTKSVSVGIQVKVTKPKEREKRGSVFSRRKISRRGQAIFDSDYSDDDEVPFCREHGVGCNMDCGELVRCASHGATCTNSGCRNLEVINE
jgi:hypothetical protein